MTAPHTGPGNDAAQTADYATPKNIVVYVDESPEPARIPHPCDIGRHRWAWLVDGRQACGYCGSLR